MWHRLIARYRIWQLKLTTIRLLEDRTDRQLADMGIKRTSIRELARQTGRPELVATAPKHMDAVQAFGLHP